MNDKIRIELPEIYINQLIALPEQGMGYQLVDLKLKSGKRLKRKLVFNSSLLEVEENEKFDPADIELIVLSSSE